MKTFLKDLEKRLPEFLSTKDLVDLNLWPTVAAVHLARSKGNIPLGIRIGRKLLFPKKNVIDFLDQCTEQEVDHG